MLTNNQNRSGLTLVELLVALALVGGLLALLLPAVQMAREAVRASECKNHLRQIGLAAAMHHDAHQHLPTNGWGYRWVGQRDRGFGRSQPGGWIFNLLPFVEQSDLRNLAIGTFPPQPQSEMQQMLRTPVGVFHCPSRRRGLAEAYLGRTGLNNAAVPSKAAKSDYAGNGGDAPFLNTPGPDGISAPAIGSYPWPKSAPYSGLFYVLSQVRLTDILDGTSSVYLAGEKYVQPGRRASLRDIGDDQTMFLGDDTDIRRWTHEPPRRDVPGVHRPLVFGSSHSGTCHFVFADGSVHAIRFSIDADVHRKLGSRNDGQAVGDGLNRCHHDGDCHASADRQGMDHHHGQRRADTNRPLAGL